MNKEFWSKRTVLVTGAGGFIGTHLCRALMDSGSHVIALVNKRKPSTICHERNEVKNSFPVMVEGSVLDREFLFQLFNEHAVSTCFHLAGQPSVQEAFRDPLMTFDTNIGGTINILEACRQTTSVDSLVVASTSHVYGDNKHLPYLESFFPQPSRPYETSKACADILAQTYFYTYGLPVGISRCTNTYGPEDVNFSRIVPKTIRSILLNQNPEIAGGGSKRDYLFVADAVEGFCSLAEQLHRSDVRGQAFNFGGGTVVTALDLAQKILHTSTNSRLSIHVSPAQLTKEIVEQYVSIDKAQSLLGWRPRISLEDGLSKTFAWYRAHQDIIPRL